MTSTIQAQVSAMTLSKVSRLFNASLTDCLNELLQNARRAGASAIQITQSSNRQLTIADDGSGIANPQTLLTLGESDWSEATTTAGGPGGHGAIFTGKPQRDDSIAQLASASDPGSFCRRGNRHCDTLRDDLWHSHQFSAE
jgi:hypothetical protein